MSPTTQCPAAEVWSQLIARQIDARRAEQLYQHLSSCPVCRESFERQAVASGWSEHASTGADTMVEPEDGLGTGSTIRQLPLLSSRDSTPPPLNVAQFCERLVASGLFSADLVAELRGGFPEDDGSPLAVDRFAEHLIENGKLTGFQADLLKAGHARGLVLGNYVIEDRVGKGGMGTVYRARHRRLDRIVALKTLSPQRDLSENAISRFQREIRAVAALKHPNIVEAYDSDEADGAHFLVMEYVDGPNLSAYVRQFGPVSLAIAVELLYQAARGLDYAHHNGLIHRDVKPGNLLVSQKGALKVLDMGLARRVEFGNAQQGLGLESDLDRPSGSESDAAEDADMTQSGRVMGTVDYMAPEQALDAKRADARADIYSLGCTLFFLLAGEPPAPSGSLASKLLWHQNHERVLLPSRGELVPQPVQQPVQQLFESMIAKDPDDRPQTMAEVVEKLEACRTLLGSAGSELSGLGIALAAGGDSGSSSNGGSVGATGSGHAARSAALAWSDAVGWQDPPERTTSNRDYSRLAAYVATGMVALIGLTALASYILNPPASTVRRTGDNTRRVDPARNPAPSEVAEAEGTVPTIEPQAAPDDPRVADRTPQAPASLRPAAERFARWAIQQGGLLELVTDDGRAQNVSRVHEIPDAPFRIRRVELVGKKLKDEQFEQFKLVDQLDVLNVSDNPITAAGLKSLAGLSIRQLDLSGTPIDKDALDALADIEGLEVLRLQHTPVGDEQVKALRELLDLKRLTLSDTLVGDASIESLSEIPKLTHIFLNGTHVTAAGAASLRRLRRALQVYNDSGSADDVVAGQLVQLGAPIVLQREDGTRLTNLHDRGDLPLETFKVREIDARNVDAFDDNMLQDLTNLAELRSLRIEGTAVSPSGLEKLPQIGTLEELDLGSLPISDKQLQWLREAMPNCQITSRPPADAVVAAWAIERGADLCVIGPDGIQHKQISSTDQLPKRDFEVFELRTFGAGAVTSDDIRLWGDLGSLRILSLDAQQLDPQSLSLLQRCRNLEELSLHNAELSPHLLQTLGQLRALKTLYLTDAKLNLEQVHEITQAFGHLRQVQEISLLGTPVPDAIVRQLATLPQLDWLSLERTAVTDESVSVLQSMSRLRYLSVEQTSLTDWAVEQLKRKLPEVSVRHDPPSSERQVAAWVLQNRGGIVTSEGPLAVPADLPKDDLQVKEINLRGLAITGDEIARNVRQCSSLEVLDLADTKVTNDDLAALAAMPHLRVLRLGSTTIDDEGLKHLATLPSLEVLELNATLVEGHSLTLLTALPKLRELDLSNTQINSSLAAVLDQAESLRHLDLGGNNAVDDSIGPSLGELKALETLVLRGTRLTNATLQAVGKLHRLEKLDLDQTRISDEGLSQLADLEALRALSLYETSIGDAAMDVLAKLSQLQVVNVAGTQVTDAGADRFKATVPGCIVQRLPDRPRD